MRLSILNWRWWLLIAAMGIVSGTIWYSRYLAGKIAGEERQKVEQWVEAANLLIADSSGVSNRLVSLVISTHDIPIIATDEQDKILTSVNLDTNKIAQDPQYLTEKLKVFKAANPPVVWIDPTQPSRENRYYYGPTTLLNEVAYYPIVQMILVALFAFVTLAAIQARNRSVQNQLWAGMAKETAHQMGTPLSSLEGWMEMLKEFELNNEALSQVATEIRKDMQRLMLVSDRFGKIGSKPQLEPTAVDAALENMLDYIRKRASGKIQFSLLKSNEAPFLAKLSPPLFNWVIENLLKNALDAMEGHGDIQIILSQSSNWLNIEVIDSGKGMPRKLWKKIFTPGFTTKKRGWGLGLSLSKRIIEQYHHGQIFVKHSEPGGGTSFLIKIPAYSPAHSN